MRGRMSAAKSYTAPFELGKVMQGGAVGEVIASNAEGIAVGDRVLHFFGWRDHATFDAKNAVKVDPEAAPLTTYLGVLGMTGLTAYAGLLRTASFKEGDTVFVSGAAGAVGSQVGQIAKLKGASRVIGSAGSDEKVKLLVEEYGFDAAFNYKNGSGERAAEGGRPRRHRRLLRQRRRRPPGGRDRLPQPARPYRGLRHDLRLQQHGARPGPKNLARLIATRGRIEGLLVGDHYDLQSQFVQEVGPWVASGELKYRETVVEGIENNLEAFLGVLRGENTGKMIVKL